MLTIDAAICPRCDKMSTFGEWDNGTLKYYNRIVSMTDLKNRNGCYYHCPHCGKKSEFVQLILTKLNIKLKR